MAAMKQQLQDASQEEEEEEDKETDKEPQYQSTAVSMVTYCCETLLNKYRIVLIYAFYVRISIHLLKRNFHLKAFLMVT